MESRHTIDCVADLLDEQFWELRSPYSLAAYDRRRAPPDLPRLAVVLDTSNLLGLDTEWRARRSRMVIVVVAYALTDSLELRLYDVRPLRVGV